MGGWDEQSSHGPRVALDSVEKSVSGNIRGQLEVRLYVLEPQNVARP